MGAKKDKLVLHLRYYSLLKLKAKDYRVLLYLVPTLKFSDYVYVNQKQTAKNLNISGTDMSKAIKNLIDKCVLDKNTANYTSKSNELKLHKYSANELENKISELTGESSDWDF